MLFKDFFSDSEVKTMLAPMAGFTDSAYRSICKSYGVGITVTEMVSSKALVMGNINTKKLLMREACDRPTAVQIFGHEPVVLAESVAMPCMANFEAVDINMGCPVRKIVSGGDGSALFENKKLASEIISAVVKASKKPVGVKFRLGVTDSLGAVDFARMCEDSGASYVTVHFRTRKQMYSGKADFTLLPQMAGKLSIPIFANGDVQNRVDYDFLTKQCGAFGTAVGRGALGKPYVFSQIAQIPYVFDLYATVKLQMERMSVYSSERMVVNEMKKHIAFYIKGMREAKKTAAAVAGAVSTAQILLLLEDFLQINTFTE